MHIKYISKIIITGKKIDIRRTVRICSENFWLMSQLKEGLLLL